LTKSKIYRKRPRKKCLVAQIFGETKINSLFHQTHEEFHLVTYVKRRVEMHATSIIKLSEQESRLVKAGGRFSSLHSVIYELLLNSLDANSNRIDVGIDKSTLEIVVRDNGNV
jgi:hypothetical protein